MRPSCCSTVPRTATTSAGTAPPNSAFSRTPKPFTFGHGIHHCIGAPLARVEAQIVFEEVLRAIAGYELAAIPPGCQPRGPRLRQPPYGQVGQSRNHYRLDSLAALQADLK
jgi:hypothetical protein